MPTKRIYFLMALIVTTGAFSLSVAGSGKLALYVSPDGLSQYASLDTTLGDYYVLEFGVPSELQGKTLTAAYLEFYVDVSSIEKDGYVNKTPLLEVYALSGDFSGDFSPSELGIGAMPPVRNVVRGAERRVVFDVTEIVKSYLEDPTRNHGLIMGSLTGRRDGVFVVRSDKLTGGSVAKITFLY